MNKIRLIIGLGNPGQEYEATRHNAGFWLVDHIAAKYKTQLAFVGKFFGIYGKFIHQDTDIHLLKPQTYMNLSGKSILAIMNFYKIQPSEILVAHDELDFAPSVVKFKFGGGHGGHNGLKDLDRVIGKEYWRLRIGIGHPGDRHKVTSYVLNKPNNDERIEIMNALERSLLVLDLFLAGEINAAMKQLHS
ncbi:MAG: aminoacyl-tRNA hydrolase [Burkholderiales bacterium]|nr:aminoacyl-tRNA hydrolase [Burkholderiales bacterium]